MFSQLHPFFLMWSTSLSSSVELSWREEQPAGWVISQAFTADSVRHLLTLLAFLLWIFFCTTESFSGLLFVEVLFKETVLLLFCPSVSVFHSFPRKSASQCRGWIGRWRSSWCFVLQRFLWQHYIKSTLLTENEGEGSGGQCLGRKEGEDHKLQRWFE